MWTRWQRIYKSTARSSLELTCCLGKISGSQRWSHISEEVEVITIRYCKCVWWPSIHLRIYSKQVKSSRPVLSSQPPCTPDNGAGTAAAQATNRALEQQAASPGCLCSRRKSVGWLGNKKHQQTERAKERAHQGLARDKHIKQVREEAVGCNWYTAWNNAYLTARIKQVMKLLKRGTMKG